LSQAGRAGAPMIYITCQRGPIERVSDRSFKLPDRPADRCVRERFGGMSEDFIARSRFGLKLSSLFG
jgi:hypothetical protein